MDRWQRRALGRRPTHRAFFHRLGYSPHLEDAIALDRAFGEAAGDVSRALTEFERERRPIVEKIVAAANASSYWYERIAEKMKLEPWQIAYDYMTRSGRMTDERLREVSPKFMARIDRERGTVPRQGS